MTPTPTPITSGRQALLVSRIAQRIDVGPFDAVVAVDLVLSEVPVSATERRLLASRIAMRLDLGLRHALVAVGMVLDEVATHGVDRHAQEAGARLAHQIARSAVAS